MKLLIAALALTIVGAIIFPLQYQHYRREQLDAQTLRDGLQIAYRRVKIDAPVGMACWQGKTRVLYALDGKCIAHIGKPEATESLNYESCIRVNRAIAKSFGF